MKRRSSTMSGHSSSTRGIAARMNTSGRPTALDNLPKAEEHVAALRAICLIPCEELEELLAKVSAYRNQPRK